MEKPTMRSPTGRCSLLSCSRVSWGKRDSLLIAGALNAMQASHPPAPANRTMSVIFAAVFIALAFLARRYSCSTINCYGCCVQIAILDDVTNQGRKLFGQAHAFGK